jgi:hypothetical protein
MGEALGMELDKVQTLVLRAPKGPAVAHLIATVPEGLGRAAACLLNESLNPSFGVKKPVDLCTIGFSFAGLEAMGVPESYLRLFRRLAPSFEAGAVRRSVLIGDSGASAAPNWQVAFHHDRAHVLVSWHGEKESVQKKAMEFAVKWQGTFDIWLPKPLEGARIGAPKKMEGEWVHFGFRDGLSEVCIDDEYPRPSAPDCRRHAPGALLLGHVNDAGFNPFALSQAPEKVRGFFRDSSFGVLRPMAQDVVAFERQVNKWVDIIGATTNFKVTRDFVKAKLCGRWPNGQQLRPGELTPHGTLALDLVGDDAGEGCPFGSHVRRMRARPDQNGHIFDRPLQRRGLPFGPSAWDGQPADDIRRGLIGHFFCASIEDQFEHLLGQWAARPPASSEPGDLALDPLTGPHENADAALAVPLKGHPTQRLEGFSAWTTTLGSMYAWHPSQSGLKALLEDDFVPEEDEGSWL